MKKIFSMLTAAVALLFIATAFGCGSTLSDTTNTTTRPTTTEQTTTQTQKESTTESTERQTSESTSDLIATLPDIDNPMTDVEPNIPESGVGDNGGIDDFLDGNDQTQNNSESGSSPADGARGSNRSNVSPMPSLPTK